LELAARGLSPAQIDQVAQGNFITEMEIRAPQPRATAAPPAGTVSAAASSPAGTAPDAAAPLFEVQQLKVHLGEQVQAGQMLCLLSQHSALFIEGRAFRGEVPLVQRALEHELPTSVEFMEDESSDWPRLADTFLVHHIANTADPADGTFAFYLPLANQSRDYQKDGRTMLLWRFRPGQRVRIRLRVEELPGVFVLPADAIAREGPHTYVFRQNGDGFDRKPVHVVYEDRLHAVIANDGSVPPGVYVAQNAAAQLNRALKASGGAPHDHHHFH
jgi:hypothetical protein